MKVFKHGDDYFDNLEDDTSAGQAEYDVWRMVKMEPMVGIEPTTYGLRNRCSTTELHWLTTGH